MQKRKIKIAYLGGGSRGWARKLMCDLAKEDVFEALVALYDIDTEAAAKNAKIGNDLALRDDVKGKHIYVVNEKLSDALCGADFVVISILPGTFSEMQSDVHLPEEYGIYQPVGDTTGPGGILRALRTVPIYEGFARAIKEYCPNAWVINYTNPMTLCTAALYRVFPEIKAFGCCHEVFGTQRVIATALKEMRGIEIPYKAVEINVSGINHFTWITRATYQGIDLMEVYKEFAQKHRAEGYTREGAKTYREDYWACAHRVKFDLFLRLGAIAAAGDRHLAEFCPGAWYLKDPDCVAEWKFALTPVSYRVLEMKERIEKTDRIYNGEESVELGETGEEGVMLMKALLGLIPPVVTNCNLPNVGQAPDLPLGAVVETNACFSANSLVPLMTDKLPVPVRNLVCRVSNEQLGLLSACLSHDYDAAFECFVNDPLVTVPLKEAKELYLRMLQNTRAYLPCVDEYLKNQ